MQNGDVTAQAFIPPPSSVHDLCLLSLCALLIKSMFPNSLPFPLTSLDSHCLTPDCPLKLNPSATSLGRCPALLGSVRSPYLCPSSNQYFGLSEVLYYIGNVDLQVYLSLPFAKLLKGSKYNVLFLCKVGLSVLSYRRSWINLC